MKQKKKKKTEILMDKLACFGLSILKLSKILMYEFWYDYVKQKHGENARLCCMVTDFIVFIKQMVFIKTLQKMLKLNLIL